MTTTALFSRERRRTAEQKFSLVGFGMMEACAEK
jgi:hypothetical protein